MPSVYKGGGCHPSKSCAEAPADVPEDDVDVDMEMEAADASDDVNVSEVKNIKASLKNKTKMMATTMMMLITAC